MLITTSQRRVSLLALMLTAGLVLASRAAPPSQAAACTTTWNGATADWSTTADWDNGLPDANAVVCINSGQVTLSTGATVAEVHLTGTAKLIVDNTNLYADDPSTGDSPDGPLTLTAGTTLQATGASQRAPGWRVHRRRTGGDG